ncbi:HAD-IA family hydrolase [Roseibium sp.]|uniref:HAD-IA family hydrolase n=1 Tax=Roseibium sp. TaxID=1936156 RepID=UPI003A9788CE
MPIRALVFDVDGTIAETEELHRIAFNQAFEEAGLPWEWSPGVYADLLKVTGGRERIQAYSASTRSGAIDASALHARKTKIYNEQVASGMLTLRPGIAEIIAKGLSHGCQLAIATTTSRPNVDALFDMTLGSDVLKQFRSIRTGEDVAAKKPDPEVYLKVVEDLGLSPQDCLAFEDSANGVAAARRAGLMCIASPATYTRRDNLSEANRILSSWADLCGEALCA